MKTQSADDCISQLSVCLRLVRHVVIKTLSLVILIFWQDGDTKSCSGTK